MVCGGLELGLFGVMPDDRPVNMRRQKVPQVLNRRVWRRAKRILDSLDGLPLLNLVGSEAKFMGVSDAYFAQVFHRDLDAGLAVSGPKRDSLAIDMKIAGLVAQRPHASDLQVENTIVRRGHRQQMR